MNVVSVGLIQRKNNNAFLITKRPAHVPYANMWEFPGGKVKELEDPRDGLSRECMEECNIKVKVKNVLDIVLDKPKGFLLLYFFCDCLSPTIEHLQVCDHKWVHPNDLHLYPMPKPNIRIISQLQHPKKPNTNCLYATEE